MPTEKVFFSSDFIAECVSSNGVTEENCFYKLFQSMIQWYLIQWCFLVADLIWSVIWLSPQYFSLERDLVIFSFCSIWFIKRQFCINTLSLYLSILRFLYISFVDSGSLLKVIFLRLGSGANVFVNIFRVSLASYLGAIV